MSITSQSTLISKARLFMVGVSPSLFCFSSVSALPSSYQLRTAAEKSPHCGRAAPALFSFSVMRQQEAGVAIRSSVHRTSVLQRLKWLGTPASCLRERVGVFVKQKHRSTPFGALAPTRSRLLQSNGRTRSESFRSPAAPPETLRSSRPRKTPPGISEPPRGPRLRRPWKVLQSGGESGIEDYRARRKSSPINNEKHYRHGKDSKRHPERRTTSQKRRGQEGQNG